MLKEFLLLVRNELTVQSLFKTLIFFAFRHVDSVLRVPTQIV